MTALLDLVVNGVCTGLGTGIGAYVVQKYAIVHIKRVEDRLEEQAQSTRKVVEELRGVLDRGFVSKKEK